MCRALEDLLAQQSRSRQQQHQPDVFTLSFVLGQMRVSMTQPPASSAPDEHAHALSSPQLESIWQKMMMDAQVGVTW
jgi:uncharacterized protein (DUF2062 family)